VTSQANRAGEFHELKVELKRPGLTARTTDGYYNESPGN
jgi:hypothetical protein